MVDDSSVEPRDKIMSSLDYSLQLLFLATQVDMTWSSAYSVSEERKEKENKRPVPVKRRNEREQVMLIPRLKKSFLSILKATKYKLANTCLPCVKQCSEDIETVSDVYCRKNENLENEKSIDVNCRDEIEKTPIKTIYSTNYSTATHQEVVNIKLERGNSSVLVQTAADGRQCFKESRQFASRGIQEVKNLSDTVSSIQKSLQFALDQLYWVEYGLNDCRWESVDRETWTQSHFLSSVGTFTSLLPDARSRVLDRSRLSLNSDVFYTDVDYSWDD